MKARYSWMNKKDSEQDALTDETVENVQNDKEVVLSTRWTSDWPTLFSKYSPYFIPQTYINPLNAFNV